MLLHVFYPWKTNKPPRRPEKVCRAGKICMSHYNLNLLLYIHVFLNTLIDLH